MTKTILSLQNFVLFKMSDKNEHSESEFYYPGELSDAELLQSSIQSESTERKSTLFANEVHNFSEANNKQTGNQECNLSG